MVDALRLDAMIKRIQQFKRASIETMFSRRDT